MITNQLTDTEIVERLDPGEAIGSMQECVQSETVTGLIGDYLYAWKNGMQILVGRPNFEGGVLAGGRVSMTQLVFTSKNNGREHRRPATWEDLRSALEEGWVVGTDARPGLKCWYPLTGRAIRRSMDDIYVFRK